MSSLRALVARTPQSGPAPLELLPEYPEGTYGHDLVKAVWEHVRAACEGELTRRAEAEIERRKSFRPVLLADGRLYDRSRAIPEPEPVPSGLDATAWYETAHRLRRLAVRGMLAGVAAEIRRVVAEAERPEPEPKPWSPAAERRFVRKFRTGSLAQARRQTRALVAGAQRREGERVYRQLRALTPPPPLTPRPTPPRPLVASAYQGGVGRVRVELRVDREPVVTDRCGRRIHGVAVGPDGRLHAAERVVRSARR